jgi:hypothetical protein
MDAENSVSPSEAAMDSLDIDGLFGDDNVMADDLFDLNLDLEDGGIDKSFEPLEYDANDPFLDNGSLLGPAEKAANVKTSQGYPQELKSRQKGKGKGTSSKGKSNKKNSKRKIDDDDDESYSPTPSRPQSKRTRKKKKQFDESPEKPSQQNDVNKTSIGNKKNRSNQRNLPTQKKRIGGSNDNQSSRSINGFLNGSSRGIHSRPMLPTHTIPPAPRNDLAFFPFTNIFINDQESLQSLYPQLFRIFSSSSSNSGSSKEGSGDLLNLIKNFVGTKIELPSDTPSDSFKNKEVFVFADEESIKKSKQFVSSTDKSLIIQELRSLLAETKQQRLFLLKQMNIMKTWCDGGNTKRGNQSYFPPNFLRTVSEYARSSGVSQDILNSVLTSNRACNLSLKTRIKCVGLKKPHTAPLTAVLRPDYGPINPALLACTTPKITRRKMRIQPKPSPTVSRPVTKQKPESKQSVVPKSSPSAKSTTSTPKTLSFMKQKPVTREKRQTTYKEKSPQEKQKIILSILQQRSLAFKRERSQIESDVKRDINYRRQKLEQIMDQYEGRTMESEEFWEMMPLFGYFDTITMDPVDLQRKLDILWQPQMPSREMKWSEPPTPIVTKSEENNPSPQNESSTDGSSLFARLQSLLVEEGVSDSPSVSESSDDDDTICEMSPNKFGEDDDLVDLSKFSLDQRAYLSLRAANLIDTPYLESSTPAVRENTRIEYEDAVLRKKNGNDLSNLIRKKQMNLSSLNQSNNATLNGLRETYYESESLGGNNEGIFIKNSKQNSNGVQRKREPSSDMEEWVETSSQE